MRRSILTCTAVLLLVSRPVLADGPRTDFDDGTPQGWTLPPPSVGTLSVAPGGNPSFCLQASDDMPAGAPLLARAPAEFEGDLTRFESIGWDEFVVDYGPATVHPTFALIRSFDGTIWSSAGTLENVGSWNTRNVPFVESAWIQRSGSESFAVARANVEALFISMDTSYLNYIAVESRIDNVTLVPAEGTAVPEVSSLSWGRAKSVFAALR